MKKQCSHFEMEHYSTYKTIMVSLIYLHTEWRLLVAYLVISFNFLYLIEPTLGDF